jgi:hypothetical protein
MCDPLGEAPRIRRHLVNCGGCEYASATTTHAIQPTLQADNVRLAHSQRRFKVIRPPASGEIKAGLLNGCHPDPVLELNVS